MSVSMKLPALSNPSAHLELELELELELTL